jgi:magnesium chelatase family protein
LNPPARVVLATQRGRATAMEIRRYLNKISGPLLDRIDIHVEVPAVKHETLLRPHFC